MNTAEIDQRIQTLQQNKDRWAQLPVAEKLFFLYRIRENLRREAQRLVDASVQAKQIDPASPWVGEEWTTGPWAMAVNINGLIETMKALAAGRLPRFGKVTTRPNGQVAVQVFPANFYDRLLLSGHTGEVWMQPGVTKENLRRHLAVFYQQTNREGQVALVLGAGNLSSIPLLDTLYRLYKYGQVVALKMNPVNEYVGPILEDIMAPFIEEGYLRFVYGGADVGAYLVYHDGVDEIHITGSARTHDLIVFGPGEEGAARKQRNAPILKKPITSELGAVGPAIVVPGRWSEADIRFQAENLVTMKLHHVGFNCAATQVLVMAEKWEQGPALLDAITQVMRELPPRKAYYPGAAERQQRAVEAHPDALLLNGGDVPRTLITGLNPSTSDDLCFNEEVFCGVYAQTSLPGDTPAEFLRNAVRFCNEKIHGSLGVTMIVHPGTVRQLGPELEMALADLRYGSVGINVWSAAGFLFAQYAWGAYPGHTLANIGSGIGVVHNAHLFEKPEKNVIRASFYPFPRAWLYGDFHIAPRPPWFVTNRTSHVTVRRVAQHAMKPGLRPLPGIFASALKGAVGRYERSLTT